MFNIGPIFFKRYTIVVNLHTNVAKVVFYSSETIGM